MSGKFATFLGLAMQGQREMNCLQAQMKEKCPDCNYSHGPYCNRTIDEPSVFVPREMGKQSAAAVGK